MTLRVLRPCCAPLRDSCRFFPARSGSGKSDNVLAVRHQMGIDEIRPVVRIDAQQCKRHHVYDARERFEPPHLSLNFSVPWSLCIRCKIGHVER